MQVRTNVKSGVKAGGATGNNHPQAVAVKTGVMGGVQTVNHAQAVAVHTGVKASGQNGANHAQALCA
jgi:hypothetical protein